jgi:membrane protease YdiL (CAAX protease family)
MQVDATDSREGEKAPSRSTGRALFAFSPAGTEAGSGAGIGAKAALALAAGRVVAVGAATALATWVVVLLGFDSSFPPTPLVATLALIPVNLATLFIARRMLHRAGSRLRDLIGFEASRLGRDVLWAFLWLTVLYLPFVASITGTMFALHGADALERFETVFVPEVVPDFPVAVAIALGAVAVLTFAPINAPAEEVAYRGLAQGALTASGRGWLAVLVPSLLFGLQHLFFAPSPSATVVYGVAFFVWGVGSALIYRWQRRLMPLIISHFLVNLMSTLPALIVPFVV